MTIIGMQMLRCSILSTGLGLLFMATGCSTPQSVLDLSTRSKNEAEFLATKQKESIEAFSKFTTSVEASANPVVTNLAVLYNDAGQAALKYLNTRCDQIETSLKLQFELRVLELQEEMDKKLETDLRPRFDQALIEAKKIFDEKDKAARNSRSDPVAVAEAGQAFGKLKILERQKLESELNVREALRRELSTNRSATYQLIKATTDGWREQLAGTKDGPLAIEAKKLRQPLNLPVVSLSTNREELVTFREQIGTMHQTHVDSIKTMDAYLNRPSPMRLFLSGAFEEAKGKLSGLAVKLGPFAEPVKSIAEGILDKGENFLGGEAGKLGTKITSLFENMPQLIQNLLKVAPNEKASTPVTPSN